MSIIGNSTTGITLSPSSPSVTITGNIAASGRDVFTYNGYQAALYAAVQAPSGAGFDILNLGTIETTQVYHNGNPGTIVPTAYVGLFLIQPGIITNAGTIASDSALIISGYGAGSYVKNTGLLDGTAGIGIGLDGAGGISNAGSIFGYRDAVFLYDGGALNNSGTLTGGTAVYAEQPTQLYNSGVIQGLTSYGVDLDGTLTNGAAGTIIGNTGGIHLDEGGAIDNHGLIIGVTLSGPGDINNTGTLTGFKVAGGATIDNAGSMTAIGVFQSSGTATLIYNARTAHLAGVFTSGADAYTSIGNAGFIGGASTFFVGYVLNLQSGLVVNAGTIAGYTSGIEFSAGRGTVINTGSIAATPDFVGIAMQFGGQITNAGLISGGVALNGVSTLANTGTIASVGAGGDSSISNAAGALIGGVGISNGYLRNAGLIDGVSVWRGGFATIENSGTIFATPPLSDEGGVYGVDFYGAGLLTNTGTIIGADGGIDDQTKAPVTIDNAGTISAGYNIIGAGDGIIVSAGGTIIDSGLIAATGTCFAVVFWPADDNNLVLTPTATLSGPSIIRGGITLAAGAGRLNLNKFRDVERLDISAGAHWKLLGTLNPNTSIYNSGTITNTTGPGLTLGAPVYNYGFISGSTDGIISRGSYLYNSGLIAGQTSGVVLSSPAYVINTGTIRGQSGVELAAGSQFYNYTGAKITGGLTAAAHAALYNYAGATITAQTDAISLTTGIAYNAGFLSAANGIVLSTGTVTNLGTIQATQYAVDFLTESAKNRLILAPTAITTGAINLNGGVLELQAARHKTGTLATLPENLSAITIDSRANWDFTAPVTLAALTNNGTITETSGLTVTGPLTGHGTIILDSPITLAAAAAAQNIEFGPAPETLTLTTPTAFAATIEKFSPADTIDLTTIPLQNITGETFAQNILTLTEATSALTFTFAGIPLHDTFSLIADGAGTGIILSAPTAMSFARQPAPSSPAQTAPVTYTTPTYTTPAAAAPQAVTTAGFLAITQPATISLLPAITLQS